MFGRITPVVKNLLILNIGIYFASNLAPNNVLMEWFALYNPFIPGSEGGINPNFKPWQFVSYMFLHSQDSFRHLFSNMFGLLIFGPAIESYMGSNKFLKYYFITGIGAAVIHLGVSYIEWSNYPQTYDFLKAFTNQKTVGASGAIFGILIAFAMIYPNLEMMLLFIPVPIKAKYLVGAYAVFEIIQGFNSVGSGIAHWAHIGGLITGVILLQFLGYKNRRFY